MFSKTGLFAFVLATVLAFHANAQTSSAKMKAAPKAASKSAQATAASAPHAAAKAKKADTVSVVRLNQATESANLSLSSQVMHPVLGRSMVQAAPLSMTLTTEQKYKGVKQTIETTTRTDAFGLQFARGLSNDMALTVSTDIGKDSVKSKNSKETANSGFSDVTVAIAKMNELSSTQQSFLSGNLSLGLDASLGFADGNQSADGNRFSGGYTLGAAYVKQTVAASATTGYRVSADIKFNRKQDIKNPTPVYSAVETTGGHVLTGELFAERNLKQTAKIGGAAGLKVIMPMDQSFRQGTTRLSGSTGQLSIMSLRAFAAFDAGQLEFIPTAVFQRNLGTTTGNLSVESYENVGLELTTRFSL